MDRNIIFDCVGKSSIAVALRKESVDRNDVWRGRQCINGVALRKESVDRNIFAPHAAAGGAGRSPQGERG